MEPLDPNAFGEEQMCFGCGPTNTHGMNLRFFRDGDAVVTTMQPQPGWEGAPGLVHGGLQATLSDEIAAWTVFTLCGSYGFTTALEVRYLRPARHALPIEARGELIEHDGARARVKVTLTQADVVVLTGTASFFLPTREQAERIVGDALPDSWRSLARDEP